MFDLYLIYIAAFLSNTVGYNGLLICTTWYRYIFIKKPMYIKEYQHDTHSKARVYTLFSWSVCVFSSFLTGLVSHQWFKSWLDFDWIKTSNTWTSTHWTSSKFHFIYIVIVFSWQYLKCLTSYQTRKTLCLMNYEILTLMLQNIHKREINPYEASEETTLYDEHI